MRLTVMMLAAAAIAAPGFAQANRRAGNQQDRVAQGVKSGELTAGETSNLERKEAAIHQEVRTDRALNGGKLTGGERRVVDGQQNRLSRQIYRDKHDAATQRYGRNEVDARARISRTGSRRGLRRAG